MEEINNRQNLLDAGQGLGKRRRPGWFLYKSSEERAKFDLAHQIPGDKARLSSDGVIVPTQSDTFPKKIFRGIKNIFRSKEVIKIRKNKREALQIFAEAYSKLKNVYDALHSIESGYPTDPEEFSNPDKSSSEQPVNTMSVGDLVKMHERIVQLQMKIDKLASNPQIPKTDLGKFAEEQGLLMGHTIDYIDAAERIIGIDAYYKTIREGLTTHHQAAGDFITYLKEFKDKNLGNITKSLNTSLGEICKNIQKRAEDQFNEANKPLYNLLMDAIRCCNDNRSKLKSPETTREQLIDWHKQVDQCLRDRQKWENDNLFSQNLKKMEDAVGWMDKIGTGKHETDFREMLTKYKDVFDGTFDLVQVAAGLATFSDEIHRIAQSGLQEVSDNISKIQTDVQLSYRVCNRLEERQVLDSIGEVEYGLTEGEFNEFEANIKAIEAIRKGKGKKSGIEDPVQEIFELTERSKEKYEEILDKLQKFRNDLKEKLNVMINALGAKIREVEDYAKQIETSDPDLRTVFEGLLNPPALEELTGQGGIARSPSQELEEAEKTLTTDSVTGNELWEKIQSLYKQHEKLSQELTRSRLLEAVATTQGRLNEAKEYGYSDDEIKELREYIGKANEDFNNKEATTKELLGIFQEMNKNYRGFFGQHLEKIAGTKTARRFKNWCDQGDLQLRNDAQGYLDGGAVTVENLSDRIKELEHFNGKIFSKEFNKEFNKLKKLSERRKCCSETYKEDPRTLREVPKIKELRKHVIDFIEFGKKEAIERVGSLLPRHYHNGPLPNLPEDELRVLRVALGMGVLHKSEIMESEYTPEAFEPYANGTTIGYKQGGFTMKKSTSQCSYELSIIVEKELMNFSSTSRKNGLHLSDLVWGDLQLLSSILSSEEKPRNMSEQNWSEAKSGGMADKLKTFVPKWMMHTDIRNPETRGTIKLFKKLLETDTFVSNPDDETYEGYIAMLATHVSYRSIYLLNQHKRFKDWEIKKVEVNDQAFNVDIFIDKEQNDIS